MAATVCTMKGVQFPHNYNLLICFCDNIIDTYMIFLFICSGTNQFCYRSGQHGFSAEGIIINCVDHDWFCQAVEFRNVNAVLVIVFSQQIYYYYRGGGPIAST
jgi:hypothetical protein